MHRDHKGYGSTHYRDTTGRNDIVLCKMATDHENLYCFVQTREPITAFTDKNWMRLFLNADGNPKTGWEGYDYLVNAEVADAKTTTLKKSSAGWSWKTVGQISYALAGNQMELAIPLKVLGIDRVPTMEFHWADNIQKSGDLAEFYVSGDSAPDGRYNYRFIPRDGSSR